MLQDIEMITMQMLESRQAERVRTFLRAKILYNNNNSTIDCTVKNISTTGAKIEVSTAVTVPETFDLLIPQKNRTYRARIAWRDSEAMGVTFIEPEFSAARDTSDERQDRIVRLERENRRLRTQIAELSKRLENIGQAVDTIY